MRKWCVLLCVLCCLDGNKKVLGNNLDTAYPVVFRGSAQSYFGYNVDLIENSSGKLALVAATRENSSYMTGVENPGVLFRCKLDEASCDEVLVDRKGNGVSGGDEGDEYVELKDNMNLGMTLAVQPGETGRIVVCAPRWQNQKYRGKNLMNGICYVLDRDMTTSQDLRPLLKKNAQVVKMLDPATGKMRDVQYYSVAAAGFAGTISPNGELLLGAPGCRDFTGTIVKYEIPASPTTELGTAVIGAQNSTTVLAADQYMGYSIAAGRFFEKTVVHVAAGAPRDAAHLEGSVYFIDFNDPNTNVLKIEKKQIGEQMGSYYGAALLAVDIDRDGISELLVAAPFYSVLDDKGKRTQDTGDEGKVYVYRSNGYGMQLQGHVMGSSVPGSRFGSAIANAGDLNMDGYEDVAIGAPYENGHGAVYIYHGTKTSIRTQYAQRIEARTLRTPPYGFGIGISHGMDVDGNHYPDIVVGAYESSHAFLLRSSPVIRTTAHIECDYIIADAENCEYEGKTISCFNITFCISYKGSYVPSQIDFNYTLDIDVSRADGPRGFLDGSNKSSFVNGTVLAEKAKRDCVLKTAYIYNGISDFVTPFEISLAYDVKRPEQSSFCKDCPTIDTNSPTVVTKKTFFKLGCGEDNVCVADLTVKATLSGLEDGAPFIVGQDTTRTLYINVKNEDGSEKAYQSTVAVELSGGIEFVNIGSCTEKNNTNLECNAGNPLNGGQEVSFRIKLSLAKVTDMISINVSARTDSQDSNPENNDVIITVPLAYRGDVGIEGSASMSQNLYKSTSGTTRIQHTFTVIKYYESPIAGVAVDIAVPVRVIGQRLPFLVLEGVTVNDRSGMQVGGSCNDTSVAARNKRSAGESNEAVKSKVGGSTAHYLRSYLRKPRTQELKLDCTEAECRHFSCEVGPFTDPQKIAQVSLNMVVNISRIIEQVGMPDVVDVISSASLTIIDDNKFMAISVPRPKQTEITTSFIKEGPPASYQLPWWAYVLIVSSGVSLLLLLSYILYKCGFFRRKAREELLEEKRKTQLNLGNPEGSVDDIDDDDDDVDDDDIIPR
ncbi:integrin alpha pat-2-like isoform X2 [Ornithodoros turicata]|uniref:integrin alpha pat-2-like isoform X2 n=1 Tax=Ornithodoros turicata TaxID=34597 RepID=UPI003138EA50